MRDQKTNSSSLLAVRKPKVSDVGQTSTSSGEICIHGAREHNLKNISLGVPRGQFVVITGVSGSGKSTLAFDLIFAEGQRRFLDSMNVYARQFVEQLSRPDVDLITGIPPTVSIEQRTSRGGGKSTVATVTEVYHFVRLLFARLGTQYCPDCDRRVEAQTRDELFRGLQRELRQRGKLTLLAPVVKNRKGFHTDVAEWAAKHGYPQVRADGKLYATSERLRLDRFREHDVEIVTGCLDAKTPRGAGSKSPEPRELVEATLKIGNGMLLALDAQGRTTAHSTERACPNCGRSFEPLDPKNFSYNSPQGWCPRCRGFGELFYLPEVERGARAEAIEESWFEWQEGSREPCPDCQGARLKPVARAVRLEIDAKTAAAIQRPPFLTVESFARLSVAEARELFQRFKFSGRAAVIARDILPEIRERLRFMEEVGLGYLQLGRGVPTLSGGEGQRIRLAAQLGSNLTGVLYILDEPTIGLHARDNERLLAALEQLKARGNSVIVVEHDDETMRRADHIIDLGPGAGVHGGQVVATGSLRELLRHPESITGQALREHKTYPARGQRRPVSRQTKVRSSAGASPYRGARGVERAGTAARPSSLSDSWLTLQGAAKNNLQNLTVHFPLGRLVLVTGVSGSGKSTLIRECLLPAIANALKARKGANRGRARLARKTSDTAPHPGPLPKGEGERSGNGGPYSPFSVLHSPFAKGEGEGSGSRSADFEFRDSLALRQGYGGQVSDQPIILNCDSIQSVYEVDQSPIGRTPRSIPATYVGFFDEIRRLFAQVPEARLRGYSASRFSFNSAQGRCPECEGAGNIKLEMNFLPPAFVRCEVCSGSRFNRETLDIQYSGKHIAEVLEMSVEEAMGFFASIPKIKRALQALCDTGLGYLKLGQTSPTLSGGEAQRVKLVSHLLSGLKEPDLFERPRRNLFILEEPTIGLHMADVRRLVEVLQRLVDTGHTVIVIEHNLDLIAEADWVIDLGPEGGEGGGGIVAQGTPEEIARNKDSHTGRFLRSVLGKQRTP